MSTALGSRQIFRNLVTRIRATGTHRVDIKPRGLSPQSPLYNLPLISYPPPIQQSSSIMSARKMTTCFALLHAAHGQPACKSHPLEASWPSTIDWATLNHSTQGALIQTNPVASSCYPGSPFTSAISCENVQEAWQYSTFHANQPESIGYPYWANNSCVPPTDYAYDSNQLCGLGGLSEYVLNATSATQIATAAEWASSRNIRIVIKGTGHDLNGRFVANLCLLDRLGVC